MPAQYFGRADEVEIESGEDGFELHVTAYDGTHFIFNIHSIATEIPEMVKHSIGAWLAEGEAARASRPLRDDQDAYAPDDPKRTDWHSVHADLYDSREGK